MISAESAYKVSKRFLNSFKKDVKETVQELIDSAIYSAAQHGDMSVTVPFKGLSIQQRHEIFVDLTKERYSFSIPEPGKLKISWQNYLLR